MPRARITPQQVRALSQRYGRTCAACGTRRDLQIDHIDPVAAGGEDEPRNWQWLCGYHNRKKGTRRIDYRHGWRAWTLVRWYRRMTLWGDTPMAKVARKATGGSGSVLRFLVGVALVVAAIFFLPVYVAEQLVVRELVGGWLAEQWHALTSGLFSVLRNTWYIGVVVLAIILYRVTGVTHAEGGRWPIPTYMLLLHPWLAVESNRRYQQVELIRAQNPLGNLTHLNLRSDPSALQSLIDQGPARVELHTWFPELVNYDAHVMLVGGTGSGKSTIARALLAARAQTDKIVILDPHGRLDYNDPNQEHLNDWLGLVSVGVGRDFPAIARMIETLHAEFNRRGVPGNKLGQGITVFMDEVPAIVDETDGSMEYVVKWIRETRKYGIRVVMLTQGKEVKTLGIEGEGSVRDSLKTVLLGGLAKGVPGNEHAGDYAGALVNGNTYNAKEDAHAIDTSGVPRLPAPPLDDSVVWVPDPLLLPSSSSSNVPLLTGFTPKKKRKKNGLSDEQRVIILDVKANGGNKSDAARALGKTNGGTFAAKLSEVWDEDEQDEE